MLAYIRRFTAKSVVFLCISFRDNSHKMKTIFVLLPLLALALARPEHGGEGDATILKYDNDNIGVDGYNFDFETSNGIARHEDGKVNNLGSEKASMEIHGSYSYKDANGKTVTVTFVADENGYRPQTSLSRK